MSGKFVLENGDSVLFVGDSITDNQPYVRTIENYYKSRYPEWDFDTYNIGWGGDTAPMTARRFLRDAEDYPATKIFIKLGMNDGAYMEGDEKEVVARFKSNMLKLIGQAGKLCEKICVLTTIPYEDYVDENRKHLDLVYNERLRKIADASIEVADEQGLAFFDLFDYYLKERRWLKEKYNGVLLADDAVHPNTTGQAVIAAGVLGFLGAKGENSIVETDAKEGSLLSAKNCEVELSKNGEELLLTRRLHTLPFSIHKRSAEDELRVPAEELFGKLGTNILKVKNINKKHAILYMENHPCALYSADELDSGVNLNKLPLMENKSADFLAELIDKKHEFQYYRWRKLLCPDIPPEAESKEQNFRSNFYKELAQLCIEKLKPEKIKDLFPKEYELEIRLSDSGNPLPNLPFRVQNPWPGPEEVQVMLRINTAKLKNIRAGRKLKEKYGEGYGGGKSYSFTAPFYFKSPQTEWQSKPAEDNGGGVYSFALNCQKSNLTVPFAFDDGSAERSSQESMLAEILKLALYHLEGFGNGSSLVFTPDEFKLIELKDEDIDKLEEMGYIERD